MKKIKFGDWSFYASVTERVQKYFHESNKATKGTGKLYLKTIVLLLARLFVYISMLFFVKYQWLVILWYIVLWIIVTLIGFNVMHDWAHGSYSSNPSINKLTGWIIAFLWSNVKIWKTKHNVLHHTYTNISEYDQDIEASPYLRLHSEQKKLRYHKFQHIYRPFLYMASSFQWIFFSDFVNYFKGQYGGIALKFTLKDHFIFWIAKISIILIYVIIPWFVVWWMLAFFWLIAMYAFFSLFMTTVFQLAHMVEKTQTPALSQDNSISNERAVHEVVTTSNFAMKNKFITWLLWWLNFQIEHHLFPHVSHIHYPQISPIVQEVCKEFNIQYNSYNTFSGALLWHIHHLWKMGRPE
jgi:linoleoyl-CoA desaturase